MTEESMTYEKTVGRTSIIQSQKENLITVFKNMQ